jgi:hypothetical protein
MEYFGHIIFHFTYTCDPPHHHPVLQSYPFWEGSASARQSNDLEEACYDLARPILALWSFHVSNYVNWWSKFTEIYRDTTTSHWVGGVGGSLARVVGIVLCSVLHLQLQRPQQHWQQQHSYQPFRGESLFIGPHQHTVVLSQLFQLLSQTLSLPPKQRIGLIVETLKLLVQMKNGRLVKSFMS